MSDSSIPKCLNCGDYLAKRTIQIIDGDCWKCDSKMKVALTTVAGHTLGPDGFTDKDVLFSQSKGVNIKIESSASAGAQYLANTCSHCGAFAGNFYLFTQFFQPASLGQYPSESFDVGWYCEDCDIYE